MKSSRLVTVRRRTWRIASRRAYTGCSLLTLVAADPRAAMRTCRVLTPFDDVLPVDDERPRARQIRLDRWRANAVSLLRDSCPPGSLTAAARAHIDVMAHQLQPALAIVRGLGTRVLLADDVGLGKTIEAGLILAELLARGCVERILIVSPAGLRDQWAGELRDRFDVRAEIVHAAFLRAVAAELPAGANPWTTLPIAIASIDYVKRPEVLPAVLDCSWEVLVVDEAHGCVNASDRYQAVRVLSERAAYVILVTATPHSGHTAAFASLCCLGQQNGPDDKRDDDHADPILIFRRSRAHVDAGKGRTVRAIRIRANDAERRMHQALSRYSSAVLDEHGDAALAVSVLHKRAMSCAWSLARTVERRLASLALPAQPGIQLPLPLDDLDGERTERDLPPLWPAEIALGNAARERTLLAAVLDAASGADHHDSKLRAIVRLIRRIRESVIVFTEYRDTLQRLHRTLGGSALLLHGGLTQEERRLALARFERESPSVLLATDAAGEGLNLHHRCRLVVSLELPWNPMRLEQRIGRVDRIGQHRRVHAIHFVGTAGAEQRLLERLRERLERARADVDMPDPLGALDSDPERGQHAHEDEASARLVLNRQEPETDCRPCRRPADISRRPPALDVVATTEAERLCEVRQALSAAGGNASHAGWPPRTVRIAKTSRRLRRIFGNCVILVWSSHFENDAGMIGDSFVWVTKARLAGQGNGDFVRLRDVLLSSAEQSTFHLLGLSLPEGYEQWRAQAESTMKAFWSTRLARERAIGGHIAGSPNQPFQAGLFDKRAERSRLEELGSDRAMRGDRRDRLRWIRQMASSHLRGPELSLMLAPRM